MSLGLDSAPVAVWFVMIVTEGMLSVTMITQNAQGSKACRY